MEAAINNICEEFSSGNFTAAYDYLDTNIQWEIAGDKTIAGKEDMIAFCDKMTKEISGSKLNNTNIVAGDGRVAIEGYCRYSNKEGKAEIIRYCDIYTCENGKINRITSYCISSPDKQ